ncbi:hypothetical protein LJC34_07910, partial [Oscillospiraceae bacterium OttesenSCG-928-G22]|nr:hypothetical protein [Oscillospiraceae bacterium OttesenSCG-928-G22]
MKRTANRFVSLLCILCLLAVMIPLPAYAEGDAFQVSQTLVKAEDTFTVSFTQPETLTVSSLTLRFSFDKDAFEVTEIPNPPYRAVRPTEATANTSGIIGIGYEDDTLDANTNIAAGTVLLSATFKVREGASIGEKSFTIAQYKVGGAFDGISSYADITPADVDVGPKTKTVTVYQELTGTQTVTMTALPANGSAASTVTASGTNFTAAFSDWKQGATPLSGNFAANTSYTATCTLTAGTGYRFKSDAQAAIDGTGNGSAGASTVVSGGGTLTFTYS